MQNKLSYENVRYRFLLKGLKLLAKSYQNNKERLKFECLTCHYKNRVSVKNLKRYNCVCRRIYNDIEVDIANLHPVEDNTLFIKLFISFLFMFLFVLSSGYIIYYCKEFNCDNLLDFKFPTTLLH